MKSTHSYTMDLWPTSRYIAIVIWVQSFAPKMAEVPGLEHLDGWVIGHYLGQPS